MDEFTDKWQSSSDFRNWFEVCEVETIMDLDASTSGPEGMWNKFVLKVSFLLTGVFLTAVHYKNRPWPSEKESRQESLGTKSVDWRDQIAPDFEITTTKGERFRLQNDIGKKVIILNFFATWCGPCRAEMPELNRYFAEHQSESFVLLGIDAEEEGGRVDRFLNELKVTFPAAVDDGTIQKRYAIEAFPTTVVIGADGKVQFYETGAVVNAALAFGGILHQNQELIDAGQTISPQAYELAARDQASLQLLPSNTASATKH